MTNLFNKLKFRHSSNDSRAKKIIPSIIIIIIVLAAGTYAAFQFRQADEGEVAGEFRPEPVRTMIIGADDKTPGEIKTVGTVKAENSIDVVALSGGTVRAIFFDVGDRVAQNQTLAALDNDTLETQYGNARTNYSNTLVSLESTRRIAEENVRQAEIGVENATESVQAAEIALATARENLENARALAGEGTADLKDQAVISYFSYLGSAKNALDKVNFIIKAEGQDQISGISQTLAAKDKSSLSRARSDYMEAKTAYNDLNSREPDSGSIRNDMADMVDMLRLVKRTVNDTVTVLDNTTSSNTFPEAALLAQKEAFAALLTQTVNTQTAAETTLQKLQTIDLENKNQLDALEAAVESAESRLESARIGRENALAALETAKKSRDQQLLASESTVDSAEGQLNLAGEQVSELLVRTPIAGKITKKYVDLGTEAGTGQPIAQVAQTERVKIETDLASDDVYRIRLGQPAVVNSSATGTVATIAPAADPVTRKVKVEILIDNSGGGFITGTFLDVVFPVAEPEKTGADSYFIPLRAVTVTQTENYIFVVRDGKAVKVPVATGATEGAMIEVISGLSAGDELITDGGKVLEEGEEVEIVNK